MECYFGKLTTNLVEVAQGRLQRIVSIEVSCQNPLPVLYQIFSLLERICKSCVLPIQGLVQQEMGVRKDIGVEQGWPVVAEEVHVLAQ